MTLFEDQMCTLENDNNNKNAKQKDKNIKVLNAPVRVYPTPSSGVKKKFRLNYYIIRLQRNTILYSTHSFTSEYSYYMIFIYIMYTCGDYYKQKSEKSA